jgi:hypothetical protein
VSPVGSSILRCRRPALANARKLAVQLPAVERQPQAPGGSSGWSLATRHGAERCFTTHQTARIGCTRSTSQVISNTLGIVPAHGRVRRPTISEMRRHGSQSSATHSGNGARRRPVGGRLVFTLEREFQHETSAWRARASPAWSPAC